jgi:hypothetical protein
MLGLSQIWALFGTAIVAASPLYLFMSLQAMSDVPSLFWTTAAVLAALKCRKSPPFALVAGCAMALDVLLRPTNIFALVPVCVALGVAPKRWILFMLGGIPGVIFFACHTIAAYGRLFTTGYGDNPDFATSYVPETLLHYAIWIPILFTPIAVLCLALPFNRTDEARTRWILGSWIASFAAFYAFYKCTHETWWYLRFLLPAIPAIVVGSLLVCRNVVSFVVRRFSLIPFKGGAVLALALVAINSFWWTQKLHALDIGRDELKYGTVAEWMTKNLPPSAVCLSAQMSGSIFYFTSFTLIRCESVRPDSVEAIDTAIRASKRPLYAILYPFEIMDWNVLGKVMPGNWHKVGSVDDVTIWKRDY